MAAIVLDGQATDIRRVGTSVSEEVWGVLRERCQLWRLPSPPDRVSRVAKSSDIDP